VGIIFEFLRQEGWPAVHFRDTALAALNDMKRVIESRLAQGAGGVGSQEGGES